VPKAVADPGEREGGMVEGSDMEQRPRIGDRLTDKSATPDSDAIRDWIGPEAFAHWAELQNWIEQSYPGVFVPEWLYGGRKKGWSLRYRKTRAFCTLLPEYQRLSVVVVLGGIERAKFEDRRSLWRPQLVKLYETTRVYPDGLFLTIAIASAGDREELKALLIMKRPPVSDS
jgi:hypothetical protein